MTFGHEVAGTVVAIGPEVHHLEPGAFVAAESHVFCGRCPPCRTGRAHICENLRILGVDIDGGFADYVVIPAAQRLGGGPAHPARGGVDPGAVRQRRAHGVHRAAARTSGTNAVAVLGCGPIGLFAVGDRRAARRAAGHRRRAERVPPRPGQADGRRPGRRSDGGGPGGGGARRRPTGSGAEVVLEMAGTPAVIDQGTRMLAHGGRMSLLGLPDGPVALDLTDQVIFKEARAARRHRARAVPYLAADDHAAGDRHGRRRAGDHPPVPAGAVRGGVRRGRRRAGRARSSCSATGEGRMPREPRLPEGAAGGAGRAGTALHPRMLEGEQGARAGSTAATSSTWRRTTTWGWRRTRG